MTWQQPIDTEGHGFHISFPNTAHGAAEARKQLIRFVEHFCSAREIISDIEAVAGEALANAAEHGFKLRGKIIVDGWLTTEYFEGSVTDDGPGFSLRGPIAVEHPVANSPRGYGLFMMQALVDELQFRNDGRTVWFRKRLAPNQEVGK